MGKISNWDAYEIKARLVPTFLSVIPITHFAIMFLGRTFWNELADNIGWMPTAANLTLSFIVMLSLVQIQSSLGKTWIEESIFGKGGEDPFHIHPRFPIRYIFNKFIGCFIFSVFKLRDTHNTNFVIAPQSSVHCILRLCY